MCTCGCSKGNDSGVYTILLYENSIKYNSYYNQLKYLDECTKTAILVFYRDFQKATQ